VKLRNLVQYEPLPEMHLSFVRYAVGRADSDRRNLQFGERAHQIDDRKNKIMANKYTGRFPYNIAVGDAKTLPSPSPSI
jgi:hypothetical protein